MVERQPSKLNVEGSSPFSRSVFISEFWGPNPKTGERFISGFWGPNPKNASRDVCEGHKPKNASRNVGEGRSRRNGCFIPSKDPNKDFAHLAQLVERVLGKDEVTSSILVVGSSTGRPGGRPRTRGTGKEAEAANKRWPRKSSFVPNRT